MNKFNLYLMIFMYICIWLLVLKVDIITNKLKYTISKTIYQETQIRWLEEMLCSEKGFVACWDVLENLKKRSLEYNK